jgi:hypothetical protein
MKTLLLLLFVPFLMTAQETEKPITTTTTTTISTTVSKETSEPSIYTKKHEVKVGVVRALAGLIFEGTYEYLYSKDFTFGSAVQINMSSALMDENFSITPFARFYFQETQEYGSKGFFVEGFGKYFSGDYENYDWVGFGVKPPVKFSAVALGICLGKKWVNSSGFVLEILGGAGRTFGSVENKPSAIFRGDISIGYRF